MNTTKIAKGWALIAEGAMELSLAYEAIEPPVARAGVSESGGAQAASPQPPPAPADLPSFDELPPEGWESQNSTVAPPQNVTISPSLPPQIDAGLGRCPVHGTPWTVKAAGVGAKGPYDAFWKCAEKDDNGYCKQKPQKIWRDTHPLAAAA
jgi:hypothetical protein